MDANRQMTYVVTVVYSTYLYVKDTFGNLANQCGWSADPEFLDFTAVDRNTKI